MSTLTNPEAALLGLLSESPKHAYHLEKDVRYRDMRYWTDLSMSSIYKLLRGLEARELVGARKEISDENRARKVYHLTDAGRDALRDHVRGLLADLEHRKWPLHVAINNLHLLTVDEALESFGLYRQAIEARIQGYRDLEAFLEQDGCPRYRMSLARHPLFVLEGELRWVEAVVAEIEASGSLS